MGVFTYSGRMFAPLLPPFWQCLKSQKHEAKHECDHTAQQSNTVTISLLIPKYFDFFHLTKLHGKADLNLLAHSCWHFCCYQFLFSACSSAGTKSILILVHVVNHEKKALKVMFMFLQITREFGKMNISACKVQCFY